MNIDKNRNIFILKKLQQIGNAKLKRIKQTIVI